MRQTGYSNSRYRQGGIVPYSTLRTPRAEYPLLRFPWKDVKQTLQGLAAVTSKSELVQVAYVNPETGRECLPNLGFSAILLRPGEQTVLQRRSASAVLHVVEGRGTAIVDAATHAFEESDTLALPTHAAVRLANASGTASAYLFMVDDAPLHRALGFYEEFPRSTASE
jgi:gentisate 1,2-dioxygenase